MKTKLGFTLMEILLVVAIIALLAIVVFVGLKPAERLAAARDSRRSQDINQILTGIMTCGIDKKDNSNLSNCLGAHIDGKTYEIVSDTGINTGCNSVCAGVTGSSDCLPLNNTLSDYFINIPVDPKNSVTGHTGYSVTAYNNGMVVVEACAAENGVIKASR